MELRLHDAAADRRRGGRADAARRSARVEPGTLVVDIGGGSTELQVVGTDVRASLDIGCVRLTERFGEDVAAVRGARARPAPRGATPTRAIGVAGTVTTIAALDLGLDEYDPERIHGHAISREAVEEQLARLAALPLEERRARSSSRAGRR